MKLFKTTPQPPDGYAILLDNLKQTTAELQNTYANLENVVDPDLIDYYIYQAKAVQMRYKFLLGCKKNRGKLFASLLTVHILRKFYTKIPGDCPHPYNPRLRHRAHKSSLHIPAGYFS